MTKGFYSNSYTGLWIYEVIGREWDEMRAWAEGMKGKEILNLAAKASAITVSTAGAAISIPYRGQVDDFD